MLANPPEIPNPLTSIEGYIEEGSELQIFLVTKEKKFPITDIFQEE